MLHKNVLNSVGKIYGRAAMDVCRNKSYSINKKTDKKTSKQFRVANHCLCEYIWADLKVIDRVLVTKYVNVKYTECNTVAE